MGSVEVVAQASGGEWKLYRDETGRPVVKLELHAAGSSAEERAMILAEVKDLMVSAVQGRLKPYVDIKYIHRKPMLYELRWNLGGDGKMPLQLWRLYFGWHSNRGPLRLALKFGEKPPGSAGRTVQDRHIDEAWKRYTEWLARPEPK